MKSKIIFTTLLVALTLLALSVPTRAFAHGEPEITVTPDTVAAGGTITIKGETMGANETFKISLEGLTFKTQLGEATSDASEELKVQFTIPANTPEGDYQVVALSEDGDTTSADLTVTAPLKQAAPIATATSALKAGTTPQAEATPAAQPTPQAMEEPEQMPSAEEHELPRGRTPLDIAGLFAGIVLSAAVGLVLLRWK